MNFVATDELADMFAQLVVGVGRNMVKLIDCDQPIVESFDSEFVDSKTKRGMSAYECLVVRFKELANRIDFAAVSARCIAKIPVWLDVPICPKAMLLKWFVGKA